MKKYYFILFTLVACNFNTSLSVDNEDEEKQKAEAVIDKFYEMIQAHDYNGAQELFDDQFYEVTSSENLLNIFHKTRLDLGEFKKKNLVDWQTHRVGVGKSKNVEYLLIYEIDYTKSKSQATFSLIDSGEGPKIVGYEVNAPDSLKMD